MFNIPYVSEHSSTTTETDKSGEDGVLEEFVVEDNQSTEHFAASESFITPQKFKNKQKLDLHTSDECDNEIDTVKNVINVSFLIIKICTLIIINNSFTNFRRPT